jgi:hypothetical protein
MKIIEYLYIKEDEVGVMHESQDYMKRFHFEYEDI